MTWIDRRLLAALAGSLALHTLPLLLELLQAPPPVRQPPRLEARLQPAAAPLPAQPILLPPEQPQPVEPEAQPAPPPKKLEKHEKPQPSAATGWEAAIQKQIRKLDQQGDLYPAEAIAQKLEGTAVVLFVLDESGKVVAARLETSSGHKILDEAAVRAIYTLHSLPADAPREGYCPVRFRLKN